METDASAYEQSDATGFIRLNALRLKLQATSTSVSDLPANPQHGAMVMLDHIYYERLLPRVAATKGLPRRCCLHRRRGILDSNRLGSVSSMGIAELEFTARDRAFVNRVSDRASPRLGLRRYAARNSGDSKSSGSASAPQSYPSRRRRRDNFYRCGIFLVAARLGAQDRQIGRSAALSKSER